jgi:hypothetical protein
MAALAELRAEMAQLRAAVAASSGDASTAASTGGVYAYETSSGTRWRFAFRQSDGSMSTDAASSARAPQ